MASLAFNQAKNFARQSSRALAYIGMNNLKHNIARSFTDTYNILVAGIGGDIDNIVCISVTDKPPVTPASAKGIKYEYINTSTFTILIIL